MSYGRAPVIKGNQRAELADDLAQKYRNGASIRALATQTGRSYGNVHRLLREAGIELRTRGGDQRSPGRRTARNSGSPGTSTASRRSRTDTPPETT